MRWPAPRRRTRREAAVGVLVVAGLTIFVVLVYAAVVVGGGALMGRTSSPPLGLSIVATALVALAFDQVQSRLERAAARLVYGEAAPPYEVWERFSSTVAGSCPAEELPARMARVLADGTGARAAEVWLTVQGHPELAATFPPESVPARDGDPGRRALAVRHGGETLGLLVVRERAPLTEVEERLFAGLADQAGLVLRSAQLRADLQRRAADLSQRADELRASRRRLVDVQDERRRALERDIHDGTQQHLVALAVNLRLAQTVSSRSPSRAAEILDAQRQATAEAIATLDQLTRGIYPATLAGEGLASALRAALGISPIPVVVTDRGIGRYPAPVEAAAYFTCLEAVQNAVKHSGAASIEVEVEAGPGTLLLTVTDDGRGFDTRAVRNGAGLANLGDRVESLGGVLTTDSVPGQGARVRAVLPVDAAPHPAGAG